jgi:hypothetical protein
MSICNAPEPHYIPILLEDAATLPSKEKTVLIVRRFGAPPIILLPRRHYKNFIITQLDWVIQYFFHGFLCLIVIRKEMTEGASLPGLAGQSS